LESRNEGFIKFINVSTVTNKDGDLVVMNRNGEVAIVDYPEGEKGRMRERERYPVVYGAKLKKKDGARVKAGELLAEWDPYTIPILTEVTGVVKFGDVVEGVSMEEKVDERTGLSPKSHRFQDSTSARAFPSMRANRATDGPPRRVISLPVGGINVRTDERFSPAMFWRRFRAKRPRPRYHRRSAAGGRAVRGA
jgi:hypothetical protein